MTARLPKAFLRHPIAHRALHDISEHRPENSRAAIAAAISAGYGIEIDLQLTADGKAVAFHDYDLTRLTGTNGTVQQISAQQLGQLPLLGGDGEGAPLFSEALDQIAGQVPLLVELKDQDGAMGPDIGPLERAVIADLEQYTGPIALMSFNPHSVAELARLAPGIPCGLTTSSYAQDDWPLSRDRCDYLRGIPDFDAIGASFISHESSDLARPRVRELRDRGVPVLCWTIRSHQAEAEARRFADNVTFEGYLARLAA